MKNGQDTENSREDGFVMNDEAKMYILQRFKTMSYFSNSVPYEYAAHLIKADMKKADFIDLPDEEEIIGVINESKYYAREKLLALLRSGMPLSRLREWCEYSIQCPIPVPSVGVVTMNQLLGRYDYFNYELNRMVRESQMSIAIKRRKKDGVLFDAGKLIREFEKEGIRDVSDEFTRLDTLTVDELNALIWEAEENSRNLILDYLLDDYSKEEIMKIAELDDDVPFSAGELSQIIDSVARLERFSTITREVARMETSEMWDLVDNIESFRLWRISGKNDKPSSPGKKESNQMLEMLKLYEQSKDNLKEGYLFQVSKLNNTDLSLLIRLVQGFIAWKGSFHYLPKAGVIKDGRDLSKHIVEGFSHEHGMDPEIFRMFLIRPE